MNRLSMLTFRGYKSFYDETTLELGNLNVLIGANQSGKSNVLDMLELLSEAAQGLLRKAITERGGVDNVLSWDKPFKNFWVKVFANVNIPPDENEKELKWFIRIVKEGYSYTIPEDEIDDISLKRNVINLNPNSSIGDSEILLSKVGDNYNYFEVIELRDHLINISVVNFFDTTRDSKMRNPQYIGVQYSDAPLTRLAKGGDNLSSVLYLMHNEASYQTQIEEYEFALRRAFPTFETLKFPVYAQGKTLASWKDSRYNEFIPISFLSDGTLRFMCLLAALYDPEPPSLLCIDEPEIGLHPDMLRLLAAVIRKASERMQIIISTHSADLLSYLESPDKVIICESENGKSRLVHKTSEELARWLEVYSLGELWKSGEIGGRP